MTIATANEAVRTWLDQLKEQTEIHDADGNLLGSFKPRSVIDAELYDKAAALFDPVEMEQIIKEQTGQGRPLAEFWKQKEAQGNVK